jgi:hypothetical protein
MSFSLTQSLALLLTNTLKLFVFPIFKLWAYIMKVISEKHRTLLFRYFDTYVSTFLLYYSFTAVFIKAYCAWILKFLYDTYMHVYIVFAWWCLSHFQQYFTYIVVVSFIGGGNRRIRRKPPTCRESLTNFIT